MVDNEVLVCGAGPVGLTVAYMLAEAGMNVVVVEERAGVDASPRAAAHHGPTVAALRSLGLLNDLLGSACVGGTMARHVPGLDYFRSIDFDGMLVGQDVICAALLARLAAMPNAQVLWNTSLDELRQEGGRACVVLRDSMGSRSATCRWLIGADGARSSVRKLSNLDFAGHSWPDRVYAANVVYDFASLGLADGQFRCDPETWAVILRLDAHGTWRVAFGDDGSRPIADEVDHATKRLRDFIPVGEDFHLLQLSPYRTHQRAVGSMRHERVILIGDAAHITAPWGGLGLTTGFWDAFVLGELLPEVAAGRIAESALDAFSAERLRIYHELTSPMATENRRTLQERDPARRQADIASFDALAGSVELQRQFQGFSRAFMGSPMVERSRWADLFAPMPIS